MSITNTIVPVIIKGTKAKISSNINVISTLTSPTEYPKGVEFSYSVEVVKRPKISTMSELHEAIQTRFVEIIKNTNGNEWQSKFSWIASRKFPGIFKEMPPFVEDGGNDGWIPGYGTYFQCYGPYKNASDQINDFIKKMKKDTPKVLKNWDDTDKVKEYHFVWNTKFDNSVSKHMLKLINDTCVALMKKYEIRIGLITSETLLSAFKTLSLNHQLEFVNWDSLADILMAGIKTQ